MNILKVIYTGGVFQVGNQSFPSFPVIQEMLQLLEGQGFDLGIRPEHIKVFHQQLTSNGQEGTPHLVAEVKVVEPLGRETLIRAALPDSDILLNIQAPADWRGHPGDRIHLQLDFNQLFVFDPTTGDTLYPLK